MTRWRLIPVADDQEWFAVIEGGVVTQTGKGHDPHLHPADAQPDEVRLFDSTQAYRTDPLVRARDLEDWRGREMDTVEAMKSPEAYAGKADDARRWLRNNPDPLLDPVFDVLTDLAALRDEYPWIAIDCQEVPGATPRACAEAIDAAVKRQSADDDDPDLGTWERELRRVRKREKAKGYTPPV